MKITKTELAKIVKEETEAYLSEREIDLEPESWYADKSLPPLQPGVTQEKLQKSMENMVHTLAPIQRDVAAFAENQLPDVKARGEQLLPLVQALLEKLQEEGFAKGES